MSANSQQFPAFYKTPPRGDVPLATLSEAAKARLEVHYKINLFCQPCPSHDVWPVQLRKLFYAANRKEVLPAEILQVFRRNERWVFFGGVEIQSKAGERKRNLAIENQKKRLEIKNDEFTNGEIPTQPDEVTVDENVFDITNEHHRDNMSFHALLYVFSKTPESRKFISICEQRLVLLRYKLNNLLPQNHKLPKARPPKSLPAGMDVPRHFVVPWQDCTPLIALRLVALEKGFAFVPDGFLTVRGVIIPKFDSEIRKKVEVMRCNRSNQLDGDLCVEFHKFLKFHLEYVERRAYTCNTKSFGSNQNPNKKQYDNKPLLSSQMGAQSKLFPPCVLRLYSRLIRDCRLKHDGRWQMMHFLKACGFTCGEQLQFFRSIFLLKMSAAEFQKHNYAYNIRHFYGLEGRCVNYPSWGCESLAKHVTKTDCHGCVFSGTVRRNDIEDVCGMYSLGPDSVDDVESGLKKAGSMGGCTALLTALKKTFNFDADAKVTSVTSPQVFFWAARSAKSRPSTQKSQSVEKNSNLSQDSFLALTQSQKSGKNENQNHQSQAANLMTQVADLLDRKMENIDVAKLQLVPVANAHSNPADEVFDDISESDGDTPKFNRYPVKRQK
eukprot:gene688-733_t